MLVINKNVKSEYAFSQGGNTLKLLLKILAQLRSQETVVRL